MSIDKVKKFRKEIFSAIIYVIIVFLLLGFFLNKVPYKDNKVVKYKTITKTEKGISDSTGVRDDVKIESKNGKIKYKDEKKYVEPVRVGYVFANWETRDKNGNRVNYDFSQPVHKNVKLYAKWYSIYSAPGQIITQKKIREAGEEKRVKYKVPYTVEGKKGVTRKEWKRWIQVNRTVFSLLPLLLFILMISIIRDIKAVWFFRKVKKETIKKIIESSDNE